MVICFQRDDWGLGLRGFKFLQSWGWRKKMMGFVLEGSGIHLFNDLTACFVDFSFKTLCHFMHTL